MPCTASLRRAGVVRRENITPRPELLHGDLTTALPISLTARSADAVSKNSETASPPSMALTFDAVRLCASSRSLSRPAAEGSLLASTPSRPSRETSCLFQPQGRISPEVFRMSENEMIRIPRLSASDASDAGAASGQSAAIALPAGANRAGRSASLVMRLRMPAGGVYDACPDARAISVSGLKMKTMPRRYEFQSSRSRIFAFILR